MGTPNGVQESSAQASSRLSAHPQQSLVAEPLPSDADAPAESPRRH